MDDKNNKIKYKWFFRIIIILTILFLCLYSISINGYMDMSYRDRTLYTEEQIKKYESNIDEGKYIGNKTYLDDKKVDYSNKFSDFGVKLSELIDNVAKRIISTFNAFFQFLFN